MRKKARARPRRASLAMAGAKAWPPDSRFNRLQLFHSCMPMSSTSSGLALNFLAWTHLRRRSIRASILGVCQSCSSRARSLFVDQSAGAASKRAVLVHCQQEERPYPTRHQQASPFPRPTAMRPPGASPRKTCFPSGRPRALLRAPDTGATHKISLPVSLGGHEKSDTRGQKQTP